MLLLLALNVKECWCIRTNTSMFCHKYVQRHIIMPTFEEIKIQKDAMDGFMAHER